MINNKLNDKNFNEAVKAGVSLVYFGAEWCVPCKRMSPIVDEIAKEKAGRVSVHKIDADDNHALAHRLGIMSVPTLILFKDGNQVDRIVGATQKIKLVSRIDAHLAEFS